MHLQFYLSIHIQTILIIRHTSKRCYMNQYFRTTRRTWNKPAPDICQSDNGITNRQLIKSRCNTAHDMNPEMSIPADTQTPTCSSTQLACSKKLCETQVRFKEEKLSCVTDQFIGSTSLELLIYANIHSQASAESSKLVLNCHKGKVFWFLSSRDQPANVSSNGCL